MLRVLALLATTLPVMTLPALAQEPAAVENAQAQAPAHNPMDCYCRANGRMFAVGEKICLRTAQGPRLAECGMVLNNTSWGISEKPCPEV